jgi:hypothetical protein
MEYRVIRTIDVDAESPEDAVCKALENHHNPNSWAAHFEVRDTQRRTQQVALGFPAKPSPDEIV